MYSGRTQDFELLWEQHGVALKSKLREKALVSRSAAAALNVPRLQSHIGYCDLQPSDRAQAKMNKRLTGYKIRIQVLPYQSLRTTQQDVVGRGINVIGHGDFGNAKRPEKASYESSTPWEEWTAEAPYHRYRAK